MNTKQSSLSEADLIRLLETRSKLAELLSWVCEETGISKQDIKSESRANRLPYYRTAFAAIAWETVKAEHTGLLVRQSI
jgi:chromosomal replication initiation ATPase DnaA